VGVRGSLVNVNGHVKYTKCGQACTPRTRALALLHGAHVVARVEGLQVKLARRRGAEEAQVDRVVRVEACDSTDVSRGVLSRARSIVERACT